ncbi:MAG: DUF1272 domain-containing protein [Pseudomonadota bacterium]|nr:DUF1272 domain-containing protein [Pseudomonadota bacterium]
MLELRPNCECCGVELAADSTDAWICSFECTFCGRCRTDALEGRCPNCGGELQLRPRRAADLLMKYPASTRRVVKDTGCVTAPA